MDITSIITAFAASISALAAVSALFISNRSLKKQLTHTANKDWFMTFNQLIANLSSAHYTIDHYFHSNNDSQFNINDDSFKSMYTTLTIMKLMLNKNTEPDKELIEKITLFESFTCTIDFSFENEDSIIFEEDNIITDEAEYNNQFLMALNKIIDKSIEVSEIAKQKLYPN